MKDDNIIQAVFKAYIWLAELNGVLCSNKNTDIYQKKIDAALDETSNIIRNYNDQKESQKEVSMLKDDHLEFLKAKYSCKVNIFN